MTCAKGSWLTLRNVSRQYWRASRCSNSLVVSPRTPILSLAWSTQRSRMKSISGLGAKLRLVLRISSLSNPRWPWYAMVEK